MLVLDTSALVKRYVAEPGTDALLKLIADYDVWCASALCRAETHVTLCHLGFDEALEHTLVRSLQADWERFLVVPVDDRCLALAAEIGCAAGCARWTRFIWRRRTVSRARSRS